MTVRTVTNHTASTVLLPIGPLVFLLFGYNIKNTNQILTVNGICSLFGI